MTYDAELRKLADKITPHVHIDGLDEAVMIKERHKHPTIMNRVDSMAEMLFDNATKLGLVDALKKFGSDNVNARGTRLSALRGAIGLCAEDFIKKNAMSGNLAHA